MSAGCRCSTITLEIRKPEITKKTSTPMNPPDTAFGNAWKAIDRQDRDGPQAVEVRTVFRVEPEARATGGREGRTWAVSQAMRLTLVFSVATPRT
jgi:hypothetical protein